MDEHLARIGDSQKRIGLRGDFADAGANRQQQIGFLEPCHQGRARTGAEVADKARQPVVDDVLTPERATDRQMICLGKIGDIAAGFVGPAAAANQHHWPLRPGEKPAHLGKILGSGMRAHRPVGADHNCCSAIAEHVFGQRQYDRPRPAGGRDLKALIDQLRNALGHFDLRDPLGEWREHLAKIHLLEGLAIDLMARDLAYQNQHRRRVLERGMDADRGVAGTGAAGDQQYAWSAGQLAIGFGHKRGAAFLTTRHEANLGRVEQRVEDFEIALARDAERHIDAMGTQRGDDQLPAAEKVCRHRPFLEHCCDLAI